MEPGFDGPHQDALVHTWPGAHTRATIAGVISRLGFPYLHMCTRHAIHHTRRRVRVPGRGDDIQPLLILIYISCLTTTIIKIFLIILVLILYIYQ